MNHPVNEFYLPDGVYFLSHSVGLLPKKTRKYANVFFDLWKHKGGDAWDRWLMEMHGFCLSLSQLLNDHPDAFCPQTNISSALVKILYSLPSRKSRNKILLSSLDFPSTGFVLQESKRLGFQIEFIDEEHCGKLGAWEKHLTENVQLAFITHVFSENSKQNPVAEITKLAKEKGIFSVVDIAQSVGVIPIDVKTWFADFIVGSSIKWLCGGPGAAFLWTNLNNITQFSPIDVGWFSHENPFEFDINHFKYNKTAYRFLGGTPSILPFILAKTSIELVDKRGVNNIYQHNQNLVDKLFLVVKEKNLVIHSPEDRDNRGGTLVVKFPDHIDPIQYFNMKKIMVDLRPKFGLRLSPHIYNTESDVVLFAQALNDLGLNCA